MSNVYFAIENGMLVQRLFVGPLQEQPVKEKSTIAAMLPDYENVADVTIQANNLKEQQRAIASSLDKPETIVNQQTKATKVIRRRRKFTYSNVDSVLAKGYWSTERRSLTKFHSNSLMYEYKLVSAFDGPKTEYTNPKTGAKVFKAKVIRRSK